MKKLAFSLLFFSAIAWLWIGHMMGADGLLNNVSGTTILGGSVPGGSSSVLSTSNAVAAAGRILFSTNGTLFLGTNYTGAVVSGGMYGTNAFCVDAPGAPGALAVRTNGQVWVAAQLQLPNGLTSQGNMSADNASISIVNGSSGRTISNPTGPIYAGTWFQTQTNYVAASFTPIAGMVLIVPSNGVLYKVTQLSTNLLSANTP